MTQAFAAARQDGNGAPPGETAILSCALYVLPAAPKEIR
jgi:hypothetical protein